MICYYWMHGSPADDDGILMRITRTTPDTWPRIRLTMGRLFRVERGFWRSTRLDKMKAEDQGKRYSDYIKSGAARQANPLHKDKEPMYLDDGAIPTIDEVLSYGAMHGVTPEDCRKFFDWHEAKNMWHNKHGRMINWKHGLIVWRDNARSYGLPSKPASGAEIMVRSRELERVEKRLADIKMGLGAFQKLEGKEKEEFLKLKTRKAELMQVLGMSV
jgi:hypothetical protein